MEGVLICADSHIESTAIKNAQHIVHFSLPADNYVRFMMRFSTMIEYYGDKCCDVSNSFLDLSILNIWNRNNLYHCEGVETKSNINGILYRR